MSRLILWDWQAVTLRGNKRRGTTYAVDKPRLKALLHDRQLRLISSSKRFIVAQPFHSLQTQSALFGQLAALLEAGIMLTDALALLSEQHTTPAASALLDFTVTQLQHGVSFSQALSCWPTMFSPLTIALLQTGEITGQLAASCQRLAMHQQQRDTIRKKVAKALRYPCFVILLTLLIASGMLLVIIPTFSEFYRAANAQLPPFTQRLVMLSHCLSLYGSAYLLALTGFGLMLKSATPAWLQQKLQHLILQIPMFGALQRAKVLSHLYDVLAMTVSSGIPLLQGLTAAQSSLPHRLWKAQIKKIQWDVSQGIPLWQTLAQGLYFTPLCRQMVRIGEESGCLDIMLTRLAGWHREQTLAYADALTAWLEPLLLLFLGGMVGLLILALYLPLLQLGETLL